jgi:hypothetical protein
LMAWDGRWKEWVCRRTGGCFERFQADPPFAPEQSGADSRGKRGA